MIAMLNIAHNCLASSGSETSEKLHIRQLRSCADNPRESGEPCERILVYGMLFGKQVPNVIPIAQTLNFQPSTVCLA
jgi:hypothetical protein